jgi:hypothetical protein
MRVGAIALLTGLALVTAGAGAAAIAEAPAAITGPVSDVRATTATATGTVNPNGLATSWYFEYGTTTAYGSRTPTRSAGSGTQNVAVAEALTGLTPGTTYHYRLVATNADGTSRGADGVFTTLSTPVAVTGTVSNVTTTSARLRATVDPNGRATTWFFEYGPTTAYGARTPNRSAGSGNAAVSVSATVSGLTPGRLYHYRVVATSDAGSSRGSDRTFSTTAQPRVGTGPAVEVGPSTARLTGTVNPLGRSTTWYFEYGPTSRYGSRTPSRSAGSSFSDRQVSWPISRLRAAATYHHRLVARSALGTTRGADLTFATTGISITAHARRVVHGRRVMLAGVVPGRPVAQPVTVLARPFGTSSTVAVATVFTDAAGVWRYLARPRIQTSYQATWSGIASRSIVIGVRPLVRLRRVGRARFHVRVIAAKSFWGRRVTLRRRTASGRWATVRRVRLNRRSARTFRVGLRRRTARLRIVMSVNQAGPGYLAGISRTIVYRR